MGESLNPILLLLHGFPDRPEIWSEQISYFKKDFHVIAPCLGERKRRGSAESTILELLQSLRQYDRSGKRPVVVIGHDIGGAHAWNLAPLLGPRLAGLVIINSAHPLQMWGRRKSMRQLFKSWYMPLFMTPYVSEIFLKVFGVPLFQFAYKKGGLPPSLRKKHEKNLHKASTAVKQYRELAKYFISILRQGDHFRLEAPVLALSGRDDPFLEPATLEELELLTTRPVVRVVEGKHWLQCEQPERVNRLISDFVKQECRL